MQWSNHETRSSETHPRSQTDDRAAGEPRPNGPLAGRREPGAKAGRGALASKWEPVSEALGTAVGYAVAPWFALTSTLRRARTFHPCGDLADAVVEPHPLVADRDRPLAERLAGRALVRLSDALSKGKARWPDALGASVRFGADHAHLDGDQDLLFITSRRLWTLPFALLTTHVCDYLANDYFAISPFSAPGSACAYFRLRPTHPARVDAPRSETARMSRPAHRRLRLTNAIANGAAEFVLGISTDPYGPFRPVARLHLEGVFADRPAELRYDPYRAGRGIHPRGFVNGVRRGPYAASQWARGRLRHPNGAGCPACDSP